MSIWVKKNASDWVNIQKLWVKKDASTWVPITKAWVKNTASTWTMFWPSAGPSPEEELTLSVSPIIYPATDSALPTLTLTNHHWSGSGSISLTYKWQVGTTASGPWTDIAGYETFSPYIPGNPSAGNTNTLSFTPELTEYPAGIVYFNFVMKATDSSTTSEYAVVSDEVTVSAPMWHVEPGFAESVGATNTLVWNIGVGYLGGVSGKVGYMTTIYRTKDSVTEYLVGTSTQPSFYFYDSYNYSYTLTAADAGYTYYASTYAVFSDNSGPRPNSQNSSTISGSRTVASPPEAFSVTSFTKGIVSASSQGASRSTTITWEPSINANRYEIQYEGSNDDSSWNVVQSYQNSEYIWPEDGLSDTRTWSSSSGGDFTFYTYIRAKIRASETSGTSGFAYSNNDTYSYAQGTAPGQPSFGSITKTSTTASIPFTVGSSGSNFLTTALYYDYRVVGNTYNSGWYTTTISNGGGTISLVGLQANTTYYVQIKTMNLDGLDSPINETSFTTDVGLLPPSITSVNATYPSNPVTVNFVGGTGPVYQIYWSGSSSAPSVSVTPDAVGYSSPITDQIGPTSTGVTYYMYIR